MDVDRMDSRRVKDKPNQAATQRPVFGQSTFGQTPQQGASQNRASGPMQQGRAVLYADVDEKLNDTHFRRLV